jgi:hypothetical protein
MELLLIGTTLYFSIYSLYYYKKSKDLKDAIGDYQRALNISKNAKSNAEHYAYLQLERHEMLRRITNLESENSELRSAIHTNSRPNI